MSDLIMNAIDISKRFVGVQALDKVSLAIRAGSIHCLAGENGSGKSTFVKVAAGIYQPDAGVLELGGHAYAKLTPRQAMKEGVQVIYQDLSLFPHMTLAENIALNKLRADGAHTVHWKEVWRIAQEQIDKIGVAIDLNATVLETSMANRQLTAICRALSLDAKLLFMDEPTAALTQQEVSRLLQVVQELKHSGIAVVFISHKLDEIFQVSDTITIFRDGKKIGDFASTELDEKKLAYYMTGRDVEYPRYHRDAAQGDAPLLEVQDLCKENHYQHIDFQIRQGDILGLIGRLGSGRTELAMSLFGLNPPDGGRIVFGGRPIRVGSPVAANQVGIALLPEDRNTQGLFKERSVKENVTSAMLPQLKTRLRTLDTKKERAIATDNVTKFRIRTPDIETPIANLSGGNAQKGVVAKWTNTSPKLFIMDSPTVGIDIGSKAEIYQLVQAFAREEGMAILFITDELEELMANCNRAIVMDDHRMVAELDEEDMAREGAAQRIAALISGMAAGEVAQ